VQKLNLKQFGGDTEKSKEPWETWLTPPIDTLPARMPVELVARFLGFAPDAIPVLVKANLLDPLGNPRPNAPKYFAKTYILERSQNLAWLDEATQAVYNHWNKKNERKTSNPAPVALAA
jgi:hypothetical protein